MKKKVILVFSEAPLPFAGAASRWYYTLAKGMMESEYDVTLFASCASDDHLKEARKNFPSGHFYSYPKEKSLTGKIRSFLKPFSYVIPLEMKRDFNARVASGCDIIHIEQIFATWIMEKVPRHAFVSVHYLASVDLEGVRFNSKKEQLLMMMKMRAEKKLLSRFSNIKSCSLRIENQIKEWFPQKKYVHFPFGIDVNQYEFLDNSRREKSNVITLIASMNWYPGKSAAIRLLNDLWPELKKRNPDMKLRIVGWQARTELSSYLKLLDVEILENVPDIKKYFYESALLIYTPSQGSGVKIKIQEAMLLGTPVVTNDEGVEGLDVANGVHALISNSNAELIDMTEALFRDINWQNEMRANARRLIEKTCDGSVVVEKMKKYYETIMASE